MSWKSILTYLRLYVVNNSITGKYLCKILARRLSFFAIVTVVWQWLSTSLTRQESLSIVQKDTKTIQGIVGLKEPCHANIFIVLMDLILSYLSYLLVAVISSQRYFLWILSLCDIALSLLYRSYALKCFYYVSYPLLESLNRVSYLIVVTT